MNSDDKIIHQVESLPFPHIFSFIRNIFCTSGILHIFLFLQSPWFYILKKNIRIECTIYGEIYLLSYLKNGTFFMQNLKKIGNSWDIFQVDQLLGLCSILALLDFFNIFFLFSEKPLKHISELPQLKYVNMSKNLVPYH